MFPSPPVGEGGGEGGIFSLSSEGEAKGEGGAIFIVLACLLVNRAGKVNRGEPAEFKNQA